MCCRFLFLHWHDPDDRRIGWADEFVVVAATSTRIDLKACQTHSVGFDLRSSLWSQIVTPRDKAKKTPTRKNTEGVRPRRLTLRRASRHSPGCPSSSHST